MTSMELTTIRTADIAALDSNDLLKSFLSGRSEQTIKAYRQDLGDFRRFLGAASLDSAVKLFLGSGIGPANSVALRFRTFLIDRKLQPTTINRKLAALRSLTALARTIGLIGWKLEIKNLKTTAYRDTKGPGCSAVKKMLDITAGRGDDKGTRDLAIIRLLHDLGLRRGELVALDIADVNLSDRTISILGKGKTQRQTLTLPGKTVEALGQWLSIRGSEPGPLFTNADRAHKGDGRISGRSVHRIVAKLGQQIGTPARPHGLRHTGITEAIRKAQEAGMGIEAAMDFSRHKDIKTLMIYNDRLQNRQGSLANLVSESV